VRIDDAPSRPAGHAEPAERVAPGLGRRLRQPQTLLSFAFAALIVVFLVRRLEIDPGEVWRQVRAANPLLAGLALLTFYASFVVRAQRMRWMLARARVTDDPGVTIPALPEMTEIVVLGWFTNCVVPARLGDVYRAWLLRRRANVPFTTSMGVIGAERLIDLAVLVTLLALSGLMVFGRHFPRGTGSVAVYGGATVLAAAVVVWTLWMFRDRLLELLPERLAAPVDRIQQGFFENLRAPWRSAAYSLAIWSMDGMRFFLVAWSLGLVLPPSTAQFLILIAALAAASPITPAGLGVVEAVLIAVLPLVDVPKDTATAIVVVERAISYWSLIVVGLIVYVVAVRRDVAVARQDTSSA
jgi:glycosyltransferase 2 family protein